MPISPWTDSASVTSPDGAFTATIEGANEIAMGAPTSGDLLVSNGIKIESCNPSFVWSDDSIYLAVPQWTPSRAQRLVVVDVRRRKVRAFPARFRVLELHAFRQGRIEGIDSPIFMPARLLLDVRDLFPAK